MPSCSFKKCFPALVSFCTLWTESAPGLFILSALWDQGRRVSKICQNSLWGQSTSCIYPSLSLTLIIAIFDGGIVRRFCEEPICALRLLKVILHSEKQAIQLENFTGPKDNKKIISFYFLKRHFQAVSPMRLNCLYYAYNKSTIYCYGVPHSRSVQSSKLPPEIFKYKHHHLYHQDLNPNRHATFPFSPSLEEKKN